MTKSDTLEKRHQDILTKLESIVNTLDDLLEDPLFLDNIHGEQELSLDLALETLEGVIARFTPAPAQPLYSPQFEADSFDAD